MSRLIGVLALRWSQAAVGTQQQRDYNQERSSDRHYRR
jgi:hypothetical protein